jgi:hypothetical protein
MEGWMRNVHVAAALDDVTSPDRAVKELEDRIKVCCQGTRKKEQGEKKKRQERERELEERESS